MSRKAQILIRRISFILRPFCYCTGDLARNGSS